MTFFSTLKAKIWTAPWFERLLLIILTACTASEGRILKVFLLLLLHGYLYLQGFVLQCCDIFIISKDGVFMLVDSLNQVPVLLYTRLCTEYKMFHIDFFPTCWRSAEFLVIPSSLCLHTSVERQKLKCSHLWLV